MKLRLNATLFALMLRELQSGPCTASEIMLVTGIRRITTVKYLTAMHKEGCVHIAEWEQAADGRRKIRVYALGEGVDMPMPRFTTAERYQRVKDRQAMRLGA